MSGSLDLDLERSRQTPNTGYHVDERRRSLCHFINYR